MTLFLIRVSKNNDRIQIEKKTANFFSLEELSNKSGISIKTIQRIESQKSQGNSYSIKQSATALGAEQIELSGDEEQPYDQNILIVKG